MPRLSLRVYRPVRLIAWLARRDSLVYQKCPVCLGYMKYPAL